MGLAAGLTYNAMQTYPISLSEYYAADVQLGNEQGQTQTEIEKVKQEYSAFTKEWRDKGKRAQGKVLADLKVFKQKQASMSVAEMQTFDQEANSALNKLDKI